MQSRDPHLQLFRLHFRANFFHPFFRCFSINFLFLFVLFILPLNSWLSRSSLDRWLATIIDSKRQSVRIRLSDLRPIHFTFPPKKALVYHSQVYRNHTPLFLLRGTCNDVVISSKQNCADNAVYRLHTVQLHS